MEHRPELWEDLLLKIKAAGFVLIRCCRIENSAYIPAASTPSQSTPIGVSISSHDVIK